MPLSSSERQRKYRARRKTGAVIVSVEVSTDTIECLIECKLLPAWDEKNIEAIGKAIENLFKPSRRNAFQKANMLDSEDEHEFRDFH